MGRLGKSGIACLLTTACAACTTASGESPGFLQGMQQAVGIFGMAVGVKAGDNDLSQQGLDMFSQGLGVSSTSSGGSPAVSSAPEPATVAQAGPDAQAVANRCAQIAGAEYSENAQNVLLQRAACLYYCAYTITNNRAYYAKFEQSQDNANSLCSYGRVSATCNNISRGACRYR